MEKYLLLLVLVFAQPVKSQELYNIPDPLPPERLELTADCIDRRIGYLALNKKNQSRKWVGVDNEGKVILETFISPEGAWHILLTRPNGLSCILSFGESSTGAFPSSYPGEET